MNKTQQLLKEREDGLGNLVREYARQSYLVSEENHPEKDEIDAFENIKSFHATTISLLLNSLKEETEKRKQADECICGIKETCMGQCSGGYNSALSDISTLLSETISEIQE